MNTPRITAADVTATITLDGPEQITAATETTTDGGVRRSLSGLLVRWGVIGSTSRGPLRVRRGAIRLPEQIGRVKLTREHERDNSRGVLVTATDTPEGLRVVCRVSDGTDGDAALAEARDGTRDAFSLDVINAVVEGDEIVSADLLAIGQVGIPAYADSRIDRIAANNNEGNTPMNLTEAERARLTELRAKDNLTETERAELTALTAKEKGDDDTETTEAAADPAPAVTAAAVPAVPAGVPAPSTAVKVTEPNHLQNFVSTVTAALMPGGGGAGAITAALADITHAQHSHIVDAPGWSGQLWSGLAYEPEFTGLLNSGKLTDWEGRGWRFTEKPQMQDYAGNKTEIPTGTIGTESSTYEAARLALGFDIDRKFFDFPTEGFLTGILEAVRESCAIRLDEKARAYILNAANGNTVTAPPVYGPPSAGMLTAAARAVQLVKRARLGRASFLLVNDEDYLNLLSVETSRQPAFLEAMSIDPKNFVASEHVPAGRVIAGVKQSATFRTLPGSPIRVDAQNLNRGGVDQAFFAYWAIEQHHPKGILAVDFADSAPAGEVSPS